MDELCTPEKTVKQISSLLSKAISQLNIDRKLILGAGLGTVGPLNREQGVILDPKKFEAPGWINVPIKQMLEDELQMSVRFDNVANTALLAEYYFGVGRKHENIAYVNCSIGIRTGVISAGSIVRTINNAEDAFGHMVVNLDGEQCSCGNYGCIECYSSIDAIVRKFTSALKRGRTSKVSVAIDRINYQDICQAAADQDDLAKDVITDAATIFGVGLANFISLLSPELIIINGPLIMESNLFYEVAVEVASKRLYSKPGRQIEFNKGGEFGDEAIAIGAAASVILNILPKG